MSLPLALINASGESRDRSGPLTVTSSASVEVRDGAFWLCEGTTNRVTNPSFEDTGGWHGQYAELVYDDSTAVVGTRSVKATTHSDVTPRAAGIYSSAFTIPISPSTTYAVSYWIKTDGEYTQRSYHSWRDGNFDTISTFSTTIASNTEWNRVSYAVTTPDDPTTTWTYVLVYGPSDLDPGNYTYWLDGVQFEQKPYATPFTVGTRVPGTLTVPMTTAPASVIVRHRQAGVSVTEAVVMQDNAATFADGTGTLTYADGTLTVGTTKSVDVEGVIAYPAVVSQAEADRVAAIEHWTWNGIVDRVPYILRFTLPEPFVISRSTLPEPFVVSRTIKGE